MKYPIFLVEGGNLEIYYSIDDLEIDLEPWILDDPQITYFDAEGRKITLMVQNKGDLRNERVVFKEIEDQPTHADELKETFIKYLRYATDEPDQFDEASLNELVDAVVKRIQNREKRRGCLRWIVNPLRK